MHCSLLRGGLCQEKRKPKEYTLLLTKNGKGAIVKYSGAYADVKDRRIACVNDLVAVADMLKTPVFVMDSWGQ